MFEKLKVKNYVREIALNPNLGLSILVRILINALRVCLDTVYC